jgi:hypothetical protein
MTTELKRTELPVGARVHHRGGIYSRGWTEEQRQESPGTYWGTIVEVDPRVYGDGSREYLVRYDRPDTPTGPTEGWWASYHIDEWELERG